MESSHDAIYLVSAVVLALCFCICATVQVQREGQDRQTPTIVMQELNGVRSRTRTGSQAYSSLVEEGGLEDDEEDDGDGDGDGADVHHMAGGMPSIESLQPQRVDGVPVRVTIIEDGGQPML